MKIRNIAKGQIFSTDLVLSIVIFFVLILLVSNLWVDVIGRADDWYERESMKKKAYQASSFLILSEGFPSAWNREDVKVLGLTNGEQNVIDASKFTELQSMNVSKIKELLNIKEYNLYIIMSYHSGGAIGYVGTAPSANATNIVSIDSYVVYNNTLSILDLRLWIE